MINGRSSGLFKFLFSVPPKALRRNNHSNIVSSGQLSQSLSTDDTQVILFGFAGSEPRHLAKQAAVYSSLGYRNLSYITPAKYIFHYDIKEIRKCAQKVAEEACQQKFKNIVVHCMSNNGVATYQQFSQILATDPSYSSLAIKGAVFDSSPGPNNGYDYISPYPIKYELKLTKTFLTIAYFWINKINGLSLKEIFEAIREQRRWVAKNLKENGDDALSWTISVT